ncbi:ATP-dependent Clp protease ATP-binding subunit ClpX [Labeo rohita]|uniref:ATP-dependent Clp protease ATP-binding subunit ClpX n=1 Tax=Labeo rohita TaxID=84645 RepID=A0ABQ8LT97_LABRO|nr:ATP-dependent Clp protease ATP-binding subunit ClpX [Labeo rohita]
MLTEYKPKIVRIESVKNTKGSHQTRGICFELLCCLQLESASRRDQMC